MYLGSFRDQHFCRRDFFFPRRSTTYGISPAENLARTSPLARGRIVGEGEGGKEPRRGSRVILTRPGTASSHPRRIHPRVYVRTIRDTAPCIYVYADRARVRV